MLKAAFPYDNGHTEGFWKYYFKGDNNLWTCHDVTNLEIVPVKDFYVSETALNPTYEELLRQNREMRNLLKEIRCVIKISLFYDDIDRVLTSCNKGKE